MARIRDNKYKLKELAQRIEAARISPIGQPVSFQSFDIENVEAILESGVEFHPDVAPTDRRKLIWEAISSAATTKTIDEKALLDAIQRAEKTYLAQIPTKYVLQTSLNLKSSTIPKIVRINKGAIISFSEKPYKRSNISDDIERFIKPEILDKLLSVRVSLQARTVDDAVNRALDKLDLIRGIWNFVLNRRTRMRIAWGFQSHTPINQIILGPFHTLHLPNGSLATDTYWYEQAYPRSFKLYDFPTDHEYIQKRIAFTKKQLKRIPYRDDIETIFIRYCRALDQSAYDVAFTKLWAVLEMLTNTPGKYDLLIKRALFLETETDRDYTRLILEHLRDVRNGLVHDDKTHDTMLTYVYQLKWFVEALIGYHLFHGMKFQALQDAGEFLDLPISTDILTTRINFYQEALNFRKRRTKK